MDPQLHYRGGVRPGPSAGVLAERCDGAHLRSPFSTDLIAGQTIDAGDVKVCNDDTRLTVTYEATFPWCLLKTDLHVATIPDPPADPDANIPQNKPGNPKPGQFAYGDEHDCEGTVAFETLLADIDGGVSPDDTVVIAAHAEVENGEREEGAWGKGTRFVQRGNWATYFTYEVQQAPFLVFVTSETYDGNLGGIEGADEKCQRLADAAHLGGTFLAWISDEDVSPSTRFTRSRVPYRLPGGTTDVASDWDDLADGTNTLDHAIDRFESGSAATGERLVWTATGSDGRPIAPGPSQLVSCDHWSSGAGDAKGAVGCSSDREGTITSTCMGCRCQGQARRRAALMPDCIVSSSRLSTSSRTLGGVSRRGSAVPLPSCLVAQARPDPLYPTPHVLPKPGGAFGLPRPLLVKAGWHVRRTSLKMEAKSCSSSLLWPSSA